MRFSKRFRKAWLQSNQRMHDMLLARPKTRYLQKWPDPNLERTLPVSVSLAALRARATSRTLELSKPRYIPLQPPPKQPGAVDPKCLEYQTTQRLMELARPALKAAASRPTTAKSSKTKKKLYNKDYVDTLAQRKEPVKPPKKKKVPFKPLSELMPRILLLCELPKRYQSPSLPAVPFVSKLKLEEKKYEASERTKQLAAHRDYAEFKLDEDFDPYLINPAALTYKATDNMKKLAEPRHKEEKRIKK